MASFRLKFWKVSFSQNIEKSMPNERRDRMHSYGIYFFMFFENHSCKNLSQNDAITFFIDFCTIIEYKWPNFCI